MAPKKVFVIRHCDKPSGKKGDDDNGGCNSYGYKRANLLAGFQPDIKCDGEKTNPIINSCNNICDKNYIYSTPYWDTVLLGEQPTKLLAAISKKYTNKKCTTSNRCCLILNPTAARYGLTINEKGDEDELCDDKGKDMATHILNYSSNEIVIVAWEHKNIPELINGLGVVPKLGDWPSGDKNDRFDLVFIIDFSDDPNNPELTIDVQNLRAGLPRDLDIQDKDRIKGKDKKLYYDDPFGYNKKKINNKKENSLRTTQKYYDTNKSKKNNHCQIIIIVGGIILSIILICLLIFFIKKLSVKK